MTVSLRANSGLYDPGRDRIRQKNTRGRLNQVRGEVKWTTQTGMKEHWDVQQNAKASRRGDEWKWAGYKYWSNQRVQATGESVR